MGYMNVLVRRAASQSHTCKTFISLDPPHCSVLMRTQEQEATHTHRISLTSTQAVKGLTAAEGEAPGPAHSQLICISGGKLWLFVAAEPSRSPAH